MAFQHDGNVGWGSVRVIYRIPGGLDERWRNGPAVPGDPDVSCAIPVGSDRVTGGDAMTITEQGSAKPIEEAREPRQPADSLQAGRGRGPARCAHRGADTLGRVDGRSHRRRTSRTTTPADLIAAAGALAPHRPDEAAAS